MFNHLWPDSLSLTNDYGVSMLPCFFWQNTGMNTPQDNVDPPGSKSVSDLIGTLRRDSERRHAD
jgi:hypothetical protein